MEMWKEIDGYEGRYEVSNYGNVRSLNFRQTGMVKNLKPQPDKKGYLTVGLCKDGGMKWGKIHRLVASAFIPNPDNKPQVNHKDGNKANNCVNNLEWATSATNQPPEARGQAPKSSRTQGTAAASPTLCVSTSWISAREDK